MSLGTATWIPGFEQHEAVHGSGGPYTDEVHVKFVWHTSESAPGSIDGIIAEMLAKQHTDVYHAMADPSTRRRAQVLPLNVSASALAHPPEVETNHDGAIQICIIGRAHDMPTLSADDLAWLGTDVLAPIARLVPELHIDVSAIFYSDGAGFTLATANARQRMAPAVWDNFNGQAGHQHVPGNDHWDPGGLNVHAITVAAHTVLNPAPKPPPQMKVKPMYDPPLGPIAAVWRDAEGAVLAAVSPFGDVYAWGVPYRPWPTRQTDFAGRQAAQIGPLPGDPTGKRYQIVDTAGEKYAP